MFRLESQVQGGGGRERNSGRRVGAVGSTCTGGLEVPPSQGARVVATGGVVNGGWSYCGASAVGCRWRAGLELVLFSRGQAHLRPLFSHPKQGVIFRCGRH